MSPAATASTLGDQKKLMWLPESSSTENRREIREIVAKDTLAVRVTDEVVVSDMPKVSGIEALSVLRASGNVIYITSPPQDWAAESITLESSATRPLVVPHGATPSIRITLPEVILRGFASSTTEKQETQTLPKKKLTIWSLVGDSFVNPSLQNLRPGLYAFYTSTLLLTLAGFGWFVVEFTRALVGEPSFFEPGEALFAAFGMGGLIIELSLALLADMRTPGKIHVGKSRAT